MAAHVPGDQFELLAERFALSGPHVRGGGEPMREQKGRTFAMHFEIDFDSVPIE